MHALAHGEKAQSNLGKTTSDSTFRTSRKVHTRRSKAWMSFAEKQPSWGVRILSLVMISVWFLNMLVLGKNTRIVTKTINYS